MENKMIKMAIVILVIIGLLGCGTEVSQPATEPITENAVTQASEPSPMVEEEVAAEPIKDKDAVEVRVVNKENYEADVMSGRYSDRVVLTIEVENLTGSEIKGVQGVLTISDLFGTQIVQSNCDFTGESIAAGETVTFSDIGMDINQFIDSHVKLYNEDYADLSFEYKVNHVVYSDDVNADTSSTDSEEVTIVVTGKENIKQDIYNGIYSPRCNFTFEVTNHTDHDIRGIQGVLTISDLFGKTIKQFNCDFTGETVPGGETVTFTDKGIEVNEFIDEEVKIYNEEFEDLQFSYSVKKIVYAEGEGN